jgi:hypothetical protein
MSARKVRAGHNKNPFHQGDPTMTAANLHTDAAARPAAAAAKPATDRQRATAQNLRLADLALRLPHWPDAQRGRIAQHFEQSDTLARYGVGHGAADAARLGLEALIGCVVRDAVAPQPDKNLPASAFLGGRRALLRAGLIDVDDNELLAMTGALCRRRHHDGTGIDATWSETIRRLTHATATLLLDRHAAWRQRRSGE